MGKKDFYINGIGIISPQKTFDNTEFLSEIRSYDKNVLTCVTPDFKTYINPVQLRRLSKMLRIGMTAATICLREAKVEVPDGIITSTGYGFLEETEKFLREMLERQEKQLTPTYFMQGTYNALSGLIALATTCRGYNNAYVSRGFAFENALEDAMMQLDEFSAKNFLIGAFDEAAAVQYIAGVRENHYKAEHIASMDLFGSKTSGTLQGEGSAFFSVSGISSSSTWCVLKDLQIVYLPDNEKNLSDALTIFLDANEIAVEEIDLWINGKSGDTERDHLLTSLENSLLRNTPQVRFKHLCGEYCTAISFGLWLGASILKKQSIPDAIKVPSVTFLEKLETVLLVNHYQGRNYSFLLLRRFDEKVI
jgi:3-oxoacyl-[acyl-carrier-protein] synthase II